MVGKEGKQEGSPEAVATQVAGVAPAGGEGLVAFLIHCSQESKIMILKEFCLNN